MTLTPREEDVLQALATGMSYEAIADAMGVTINTVRTHIRSLYAKLEVSTRTEAVLIALRLGLVEFPAR